MVFDKKMSLLKESILALVQNHDLPFLERMKIGIEAHFDFLTANPGLPRFAINELFNKPQRWEPHEPVIKKVAAELIGQLQQEIDEEAARGTIRPIDATVLLLDIASLNIFLFAVTPVVRTFAMSSCKDEKEFFEMRKKESVEVIMKRLVIERH